jgi:hypothetical protein
MILCSPMSDAALPPGALPMASTIEGLFTLGLNRQLGYSSPADITDKYLPLSGTVSQCSSMMASNISHDGSVRQWIANLQFCMRNAPNV